MYQINILQILEFNSFLHFDQIYPKDIHLPYMAPLFALILIFKPVVIISSHVTAAREFNAEATVL